VTDAEQTLDRLKFDASGLYEITTKGGSIYTLDLDAKTMLRRRGEPVSDEAISVPLRQDEKLIELVGIRIAQVGLPATFIIDLNTLVPRRHTLRITSTIVSITRLDRAAA
tara:strand:- start:23343 stop:23672 length:330 start_codon:yes stop_codon:yes gene_type:complete